MCAGLLTEDSVLSGKYAKLANKKMSPLFMEVFLFNVTIIALLQALPIKNLRKDT